MNCNPHNSRNNNNFRQYNKNFSGENKNDNPSCKKNFNPNILLWGGLGLVALGIGGFIYYKKGKSVSKNIENNINTNTHSTGKGNTGSNTTKKIEQNTVQSGYEDLNEQRRCKYMYEQRMQEEKQKQLILEGEKILKAEADKNAIEVAKLKIAQLEKLWATDIQELAKIFDKAEKDGFQSLSDITLNKDRIIQKSSIKYVCSADNTGNIEAIKVFKDNQLTYNAYFEKEKDTNKTIIYIEKVQKRTVTRKETAQTYKTLETTDTLGFYAQDGKLTYLTCPDTTLYNSNNEIEKGAIRTIEQSGNNLSVQYVDNNGKISEAKQNM